MNLNLPKLNDKLKDSIVKYIIILILLLPVAYILNHIYVQAISRMAKEISLSYTADAPIYWTIGKGMLEGLKPYVDFYETKPPGIFILSALSFAITDSAIITNAICFLSLIVIGLIPVIYVFLCYRKNHTFNIPVIVLYAGAALFGAMLMLYTQYRSGSAQVESIGAAFGCIYLILISTIDGKKTKYKSPKIWIAAFFLMCSVMMKEPFVLICCSAALIFIKTIKDAWKKLALPLCAGGVIGVLIMLITGTLIPYIKYYLPNMLGGHISRYGSPKERGYDFKKILNDIGAFSTGLQTAIFVLTAFIFISVLYKQFNRTDASILSIIERIYHVAKLFAIGYLAVYSVALGGQYYNHHYIFAVPTYVALFLCFSKEYMNIKLLNKNDTFGITGIILSVAITCSAGALLLPDYEYDSYATEQKLEKMQNDADYVDDILEATGVERYQFLGFNGEDVFYCFTQHLPQGPIFIQDRYNFTDINNWFCQSLIEQLDNSDIIIIQKIETGILDDYINLYLENNFTETPWPEAANVKKSDSFDYTILFRIK